MRNDARKFHSKRSNKTTHYKTGPITGNPFLNFLRDFRECNPALTVTELTRRGGEVWRRMTDRQKLPYMQMAKKVQHQRRSVRQRRPCKKRRTGTSQETSESAVSRSKSTKSYKSKPRSSRENEELKKHRRCDRSSPHQLKNSSHNNKGYNKNYNQNSARMNTGLRDSNENDNNYNNRNNVIDNIDLTVTNTILPPKPSLPEQPRDDKIKENIDGNTSSKFRPAQ